jgi:hypothetical protein
MDEYEQPAPEAVHPPAVNSVLTAVPVRVLQRKKLQYSINLRYKMLTSAKLL